MEMLTILKFWKSNNAKVLAGANRSDGDVSETVADSAIYDPLTEESDYEDDDSFFELELTLPSYASEFPKSEPCWKISEQQKEESEHNQSSDARPQSPVSVLCSPAPKLGFFMFGKLDQKLKREESETESVSSNVSPRKSSSSLFTVKFKIEDGSIVPKFYRSNSSGLFSPKRNSDADDCSESSKRFSKDVLQKYFHLIKPSFAKSSKKCVEKEKFVYSPARSTVSAHSPRKERGLDKLSGRLKVKCRQLGKSKSASSVIPPARNDHCLDGIEGAILHCKRSLSSPKGDNV